MKDIQEAIKVLSGAIKQSFIEKIPESNAAWDKLLQAVEDDPRKEADRLCRLLALQALFEGQEQDRNEQLLPRNKMSIGYDSALVFQSANLLVDDFSNAEELRKIGAALGNKEEVIRGVDDRLYRELITSYLQSIEKREAQAEAALRQAKNESITESLRSLSKLKPTDEPSGHDEIGRFKRSK